MESPAGGGGAGGCTWKHSYTLSSEGHDSMQVGSGPEAGQGRPEDKVGLARPQDPCQRALKSPSRLLRLGPAGGRFRPPTS